ncbi:MAG: HD-GYP domain-containing protein [Nitrospirae bacterium]|nr:HD-GYP domain-containing protein [Nitrospirota bacterium]MCL5284225.1 HD-GYP domain-containing protein [Nitrospirota bacterium]
MTPDHVSILTRDFYRTMISVVDELMAMLDRWTFETRTHSCRVTLLSLQIGESLGLAPKELFRLGAGSLLHDIGKIRIPQEILMKPGPLSPEEWRVMKMHPQLGCEILERFPPLRVAGDLVVQHQERWDGSGYPNGLKKEDICLNARIFAVADSFDAMTNQRSYNTVRQIDDAILELLHESGSLYDPHVVRSFISFAHPPDDNEIMDNMERFLEEVFPPERFIQTFLS